MRFHIGNSDPSIRSYESDTESTASKKNASNGSVKSANLHGPLSGDSLSGTKHKPNQSTASWYSRLLGKDKTPKKDISEAPPTLPPIPPLSESDYIKVSSNAGLRAIYPEISRATFVPPPDHMPAAPNQSPVTYNRALHEAMHNALDQNVEKFDRTVFLAPKIQQEYESRAPGIWPILQRPENLGILHSLQQNPELRENFLQALERPWWRDAIKETPQLLQRMLDKPSIMSKIVPPTETADSEDIKTKLLKGLGKNLPKTDEPPTVLVNRLQHETAAYERAVQAFEEDNDRLKNDGEDIAFIRGNANNPANDASTMAGRLFVRRCFLHEEETRTVHTSLLKARALLADGRKQLAVVMASNPDINLQPVFVSSKQIENAKKKIDQLDASSMARLKFPDTPEEYSLNLTDGAKHGYLKSLQLKIKHRKETPEAKCRRLGQKIEVYDAALTRFKKDKAEITNELQLDYEQLHLATQICGNPRTATNAWDAHKKSCSANIARLHEDLRNVDVKRDKMQSLRDHTQREMDVVVSLNRLAVSSRKIIPTARQIDRAIKKASKLSLNQAARNNDLRELWVEPKESDSSELSPEKAQAQYELLLEKMGEWVDPQTLHFNRENISAFARLLESNAFPSVPDHAPAQLKALRTHIGAHLWEITQIAGKEKMPALSDEKFADEVQKQIKNAFPALSQKAPDQLREVGSRIGQVVQNNKKLPLSALALEQTIRNEVFKAFPDTEDVDPVQLQAVAKRLWQETPASKKSPLSESEFGFLLRDQFAEVAKKSALLHKSFRGTPSLKFANLFNADDAAFIPTFRDGKLAAHYALMTDMAGELKRRAVRETAVSSYDEGAKLQVEKMEKVSPGVSDNFSGTNSIAQTNANIVHNFLGFLNLEISGGKTLESLNVDDRNVDVFDTKNAAVSIGFGRDFGKFAQWALAVSLSFEQEGGRLFKRSDIKSVEKLLLHWNTNHAWQTSCSPAARKFMTALNVAYNETTKNTGARLNDLTSTVTHIADKKISKGYNDARLRRLASAVDNNLETAAPKIASLVEKAFPNRTEIIKKLVDNGAASKELPKDTFRESVPDSTPVGKVKHRYLQNTNKVKLSDGTNKDALFGLGLEQDFIVDRMTINVHTVDAGNTLLNTNFHKDAQQTLSMHRQLDSLLHDEEEKVRSNPPKLHLYNGIRKKLRGENPPVPDFSNDPEQFDYYIGRRPNDGETGLETIIPQQFRATFADSSPKKLDEVAALCQSLSHTYADFIANSEKFLVSSSTISKRDKSPVLMQLRAEEQAAKEDAFNAINAAVWNNSYPGGRKAAMKSPKKFIAQTHDAISLGLGCAGTHLAILQREIVRRFNTRALANQQAVEGDPVKLAAVRERSDRLMAVMTEKIRKANVSYDQSRTLLENGYVGLRKDAIIKKATFQNKGLVLRWNYTAKSLVQIGGVLNPIGAMVTKAHQSIGGWQESNELGQLQMDLQLKYFNTYSHPNPARRGDFFDLKLDTAVGVPMAEKAVTKLVSKALDKMYPGIDVAAMKVEKDVLVRDIMQMAFAARTGGATLQIRLHKLPKMPGQPSGIKDRIQAYSLQYVRLLENKNTGLGLVVPTGAGNGEGGGVTARDAQNGLDIAFPTAVGDVTVGLNINELSQRSVLELKGADLGYQIIQFGEFQRLLDDMQIDKVTGLPKRALDDILLGKRDASGTVLEPATKYAQMTGAGYFGRVDTISSIVDQYIKYRTSLDNAGGDPTNVPHKERNDFYRYYETEPFKRISKVANEVDHHAPGSANKNPFELPIDLREAAEKTYTEKVGSGAGKFEWAAEQAHIAGLHSVQDRIAYFSGKEKNPGPDGVGTHGPEVLRMFADILGSASKINTIATRQLPKRDDFGYAPVFSDKRERADVARALNLQDDNAIGVKDSKLARVQQRARQIVALGSQNATASANSRTLTNAQLRNSIANGTASEVEKKEWERRNQPAGISTAVRLNHLFTRPDPLLKTITSVPENTLHEYIENPQRYSKSVVEAAQVELHKLEHGNLAAEFGRKRT